MATSTDPSDFQIVDSWDEAEVLSTGYEDQELTEYYLANIMSKQPWMKFHKYLSPRLTQFTEREIVFVSFLSMATSGLKNNKINILDVGGGNGYMAHLARKALPQLEFSWTVLESESCANAYSRFETESNIRWVYELPDLKCDITLMSCSLQYLKNFDHVLEKVLENSQWLMLMRLPLIDQPTNQITVQRVVYGEQVFSWPCWFFSKELALNKIEKFGELNFKYTCLDESVNFGGMTVPMENYLISCRNDLT